jgi:hypothetical protein
MGKASEGPIDVMNSSISNQNLVVSDPETRSADRAGELVYLDFDGVLHPDAVWFDRETKNVSLRAPGHQLFESIAVFEEAIAPYPSVQIVLTTSWVSTFGLAHTIQCLPETLQNRVIGATYDPTDPNAWLFDRLTRYDAIVQDVARRRPRCWLAVDDDGLAWPHNERDSLLLVPSAMGLQCAATRVSLQARLRAMVLASSRTASGREDVGQGRTMPVTEQQLADLRAARKVLAINAASTAGGRSWIHPRFQFDGSGQPFAEIAQVLEAFGDTDPIAVCDWFAEPNPLLDNHPPMKFWWTDRARVVQAALAEGADDFGPPRGGEIL